jgi:hypothetical protein
LVIYKNSKFVDLKIEKYNKKLLIICAQLRRGGGRAQ